MIPSSFKSKLDSLHWQIFHDMSWFYIGMVKSLFVIVMSLFVIVMSLFMNSYPGAEVTKQVNLAQHNPSS